ncbi:hypothetical protein TNCV_5073641 [Trichonephila clavipes]|nr:hypothetical protein TNCV_5073641 [Trichonephila clavipes]
MTRNRLASLTVELYGISYFLEGSSAQSCGRWRIMEGFMETDFAGSHHLQSISQSTKMNSYSNEDTSRHVDSYADYNGLPFVGCTRNVTPTGVFHITRPSQV